MVEKKIAGEKTIYKQKFANTPNYLMIEPTNRCNMKCRMCSREGLNDIGDMEWGMFVRILDMIPEISTLKFQGLGEAYLARDAVKMLELCKEKNIDVVSITNCLWPRNIDIPYVMSMLKHLYISYHAADETTYLKIVGTGNWELLHQNIRKIVENKADCDVVFNCVLSNLNYMQAPQVVERASIMGVKCVRFQIMQNWTTEGEELHNSLADIQQMNMDVLIENLKEAYEKGEELGVSINLVGNDQFDYTHCIWPFERTYINKNGDVLPCHMRPDPQYAVGNIELTSFDEIWNGDKLNNMRNLLSQNKAPEMCKDCPYISAAKQIRIIKQRLNENK